MLHHHRRSYDYTDEEAVQHVPVLTWVQMSVENHKGKGKEQEKRGEHTVNKHLKLRYIAECSLAALQQHRCSEQQCMGM
jgi:hypothetical protein